MRLMIVAIAALAVSACFPSDQNTDASDESAAVAQAIYDAFAVGDVAGFTALLDPEIVWNEAENYPYDGGNPYIGPDAVMGGVIGPIVNGWDGFAATPEHMIAQGNQVAVMGRYTGTFNATGTAMDAQFVHVWTIENGRAIAFQQYADTWQARNVMGLD